MTDADGSLLERRYRGYCESRGHAQALGYRECHHGRDLGGDCPTCGPLGWAIIDSGAGPGGVAPGGWGYDSDRRVLEPMQADVAVDVDVEACHLPTQKLTARYLRAASDVDLRRWSDDRRLSSAQRRRCAAELASRTEPQDGPAAPAEGTQAGEAHSGHADHGGPENQPEAGPLSSSLSPVGVGGVRAEAAADLPIPGLTAAEQAAIQDPYAAGAVFDREEEEGARYELRPSTMWLTLRCPESCRIDHIVRADLFNPLARLGSAVHEVIARVRTDMGGRESGVQHCVGDVAQRWDIDAEELERLAGRGLRLMAVLEEQIPELADAEVEFPALIDIPGCDDDFRGTIDYLAWRGRFGIIVDIKSGFREESHAPQLLCYAAAVLQGFSDLDEVYCYVPHIRTGTIRPPMRVNRDQAAAWLAHVGREAIGRRGTHVIGDHCQLCRRRYHCPAVRSRVLSVTAEALGGDGVESTEQLTAEQLLALRRSGAELQRIGKDRVQLVRDHVLQRGPVVTDEATVEALVEGRRNLDPRRAIPVLRRLVGDEALLGAVSMRVGDVDAAAKSAGAVPAQVWRELDDAGAVSRTTYTTVREVGR